MEKELKELLGKDIVIQSIKKEELEEDDILVFSIDGGLSDEAFKRVKNEIKRIFNHKKICLLSDGLKIDEIVKVKKEN